eukprot:SAG11_NODE_16692_length_540_cov_1.151927_2_plen_38_part_01
MSGLWATQVGISLSIHEIVWVVRYLIDLVPSMLELMEP